MARAVRNWLLRQLNSKDVLDGVTVTVKLAVEELGAKTVASELRRIAKQLEGTGSVQGWKFPQFVPNGSVPKTQNEAAQTSQTRLQKQARSAQRTNAWTSETAK